MHPSRVFKIQEEREMNTYATANRLHSLNRKLKKPTALFIVALFAAGILSAFSVTSVSAATSTSALHTSGSYILDADGNVVYLRGMGLAGMVPDLLLWGQGQSDNWGNQWNYNPTSVMDQTFAEMRDKWHINMIRVFIYPSWYYRDNIVPAQEDPASYGSSTTPISVKTYLRTLCQEADKYGIYVNVVPYMLTPSSSSFGADPYASSGYGWQGMPMCGWDEPAQRFLRDAGYGNNELGFWSWFWTDMANTLKDYPNAIFEAWNEPNLGSDVDPIPSGYMSYLTTMYNAIRSTGATNLIMMQWHMGWFPNGYGNDLSWCKQIATAIPTATNLVYTTHLYYYAPTDLTSYWAKDYAGLKAQLQAGIATMGVTAPLVINEEGSCLQRSPNRQNDVNWWTNLLKAQYDLGVGACAYYWLSDSGLGGVYAGETMLSSGYTPNDMGTAFINAYVPQQKTTVATPTPTPAPTETPEPTPVATPEPTAEPTATPQPTTESTSTATPEPAQTSTTTTSSSAPKQTATSTPTPSPQPTSTPAPTPEPTESTQHRDPEPAKVLQPTFEFTYKNWFILYWPRFNMWFAYRYW